MKKQSQAKIKQLSTQIGHFIRYWGFRKIHGEIWTLVYLSDKPLSGVEICSLLKVSKALISPALKQLEDEGLIKQILSENSKTKRYEAEEDVLKIILGVLQRREKPLLEKIKKHYEGIRNQPNNFKNLKEHRIETLGLMIQMAQLVLNQILEADDTWNLTLQSS